MTEQGLRKLVASFSKANNAKALLEVFLSIGGYAIFIYGIYYALTYGHWVLYFCSMFVAALFSVKVFTIQHDCGHGSMFSSDFLNTAFGRLTSLITTMPFTAWKTEHDIHHGHVVDIEKVGHGDIGLFTVEKYNNATPFRKWFYRLYRNPLFLLIVSPFFYFFIKSKIPALPDLKNILSVVWTNIFAVAFFGFWIYTLGFWTMVFTFVPAMYLGGIAGIALFYLQHTYPDASWFTSDEWEHEHASLEGSSLIVLPQPIEWFSHAIGYHHIHHLNSKIPGYRLKEVYDDVKAMQVVKPLTWRDVIDAFKLKLWSYEKDRFITFKELSTVTR